ncbi:MAG: bifunctional isocitrate dehydrogenase kinase/phosphatase, partial [Actinobacteria bacterium]|nr:bifunctional isocitrate dehydrogenase kinase/phosphatase [Actinomycetota bacterium]NIS31245.1 bifunctional isocitrate dehydrogenase kinase/phosphatase [Actinomycetota bacterium]NIT95557.1 bifunctional isocitrate dehydrogenase kinase/phosphatase [Actinomycetota bacterium]NIU19251.1 bifunctional isocitrate dehydrogenase kinase/phosphatase [Actinomycetota bacterium]NIU66381.1 bifunctional isocitrate dehydrogenase kinase/phosphatase [Actinomycetota bacterium]
MTAIETGPSRDGEPVDPAVERLARMLHDAFVDYHDRYLEVTHRAQRRFLDRDWEAHQTDTTERLSLHKRLVRGVVDAARLVIPDDDLAARALWVRARRR